VHHSSLVVLKLRREPVNLLLMWCCEQLFGPFLSNQPHRSLAHMILLTVPSKISKLFTLFYVSEQEWRNYNARRYCTKGSILSSPEKVDTILLTRREDLDVATITSSIE